MPLGPCGDPVKQRSFGSKDKLSSNMFESDDALAYSLTAHCQPPRSPCAAVVTLWLTLARYCYYLYSARRTAASLPPERKLHHLKRRPWNYEVIVTASCCIRTEISHFCGSVCSILSPWEVESRD